MNKQKVNKPVTKPSLVHQLEDVVLALEGRGESEQEIHSMVAMILRGFIRNGVLTEEYIELAKQAQQFRQQNSRVLQEQAELDAFRSAVLNGAK